MDRQTLGAQGEAQAAELLRLKGYHILVTNLRTRFSEADIVAADGNEIVIVEVKTRSTDFADPITAVTPLKIRRLRRAMRLLAAKYPERNVRLDVVTVYWKPEETPILTHYENVI